MVRTACEGHPDRWGEVMADIPTERGWIRICLSLGWQPKHVKALRQFYRQVHPPKIAEFDYSAGPPYAVRYRGHIIRKPHFKTPEEAEEWGIENYKGSFDGWEVISLAPRPTHTAS